ncbi:MAG TPA: valine--tRNA ligase, partial [Gammaproteobacteria bacterium]|nr:valine--tRNA ligase [Gammaproteobacteria bacterium]
AGGSIMRQPYPAAKDFPQDENAIATVAWLKLFIMGVRRIRAERDIPPGKRLSVLIKGGTAAEHGWLRENLEVVRSLARIDAITPTGMEPEDAVIALAGEMTLLVPLAELIDLEAELARLKNDLGRKQAEIDRLQGKLDNRNFVERAPQEVVAQERQRLEETRSAFVTLQAQHDRIAALV